MKNGYWLYACLTLVILTVIFTTGCPPKTKVCEPSTFCPREDVGRKERELIVQLNPFYEVCDIISEKRDSFQICTFRKENDQLDSIRVKVKEAPQGIRCLRRSTVFYTGKDAFLEQLNDIAFQFNPTATPKINSYKIIKDCNCEERLILISISLPPDVDINNGVAKGSSSTEENNGPIGAIGHNYEIYRREENNLALGTVPTNAGTCTTVTPSSASSPERPKEFVNTRDPDLDEDFPRDLPCDTLLIPVLEQEDLTPASPRIAIIDTGVDPLYKYLKNSSTLVATHVFTDEFTAWPLSQSINSFDYGNSITLNGTDDDGNCLEDDFFGYDFFHEDNNPSDLKGHGTHIAYTVLSANNIPGLNAKILPLQFGGYTGWSSNPGVFKCDLFSAICSISYATAEKVDIINMSWGYYSTDTHQVLRNVIQRAADADILMIASMGNDSVSVDSCLHWPSNFSTVTGIKEAFLSVAALATFTNNEPVGDLKLAGYSNYGTSADLAAPGSNIMGALVRTDQTIRLSGTSMSAAVMSRQAAIKMYAGGVKLSAEATKVALLAQTVAGNDMCAGDFRIYDYTDDTTLLSSIGY